MNWQSFYITWVLIWNKDDAAIFLGVQIEHIKPGLLKVKQEGLIDYVIESLGVDVGTMLGKATPADAKPLVKDTEIEVAHGDFRYSSVVGMMLYISGHSRPDIAHAVNFAACCM